ncbi:MAG: hypothetical protein JXR88_09715 [Clostridia bacterium]|nr:hypothetical protein [Clostridia bacterium]
MLVVSYMLLSVFYVMLNPKIAHREKWFSFILVLYLLLASYSLTDTFLDFTLVITGSLLLYLLMIFLKRELSTSVILILVVMSMMLAILVGLVEKSSLQPFIMTLLTLYLPVLAFGPKGDLQKKEYR